MPARTFLCFAYLACALLAAGRTWSTRTDRIPVFWPILTILLLLCAAGRAYEAFTPMAGALRFLIQSEDLYAWRRPIQVGAIGLLVAGQLAAMIVFFRRLAFDQRSSAIMFVVLLDFIAVRASSLHQVDAFLERRPVGFLNLSELIELTLLALLGVAMSRRFASSRS